MPSFFKNITIDDVGYVKLPVGDTSQRPGNTQNGQIRFNSDRGIPEFRDNAQAEWKRQNQPSQVVATGGDAVYDIEQFGKKYRVHVFTQDGAFSVSKGGDIEYLVVAGGGASSSDSGGGAGGGAGGAVTGKQSISTEINGVSIGAGGFDNSNGENSSFLNITAIGGGAAGSNQTSADGKDGGSGGGSISQNGSVFVAGGSGAPNQGNDGGEVWPGSNVNDDNNAAGGGGGATQAGGTGSSAQGGAGGQGILSTITGLPLFYAGGGGGGTRANGSGGKGGLGGGTDGVTSGTAIDATPSSGGGAGANRSGNGSNGGSGIVVARYEIRDEEQLPPVDKDVTEGLVLDLDFAKPTVYTGSGSTVSDSRLFPIEGSINGASYVNARTHRAAFEFDGSDDEINFGNVTGDFSNITVTVWFRPFRVQDYENVLDCNYSTYSPDSGNIGPRLEMQSDGSLGWLISGDTGDNNNNNTIQVVSNLSSNAWVSSSLTYDGSTIKVYLNGDFKGQANATAGFVDVVSDLRIGRGFGRSSPGNRSMQGEIGLVRLYDFALTDSQIQDIYDYNKWRFGV